jgi:pimeloyl-ACP methyl ester carboxylesterase
MATDVREFIEQRTLRRVMVLSHSTGGKVAMQFDIDYSEQVDRLIVADIAPKAYEPSHRSLVRALRSLDLSRLNGTL